MTIAFNRAPSIEPSLLSLAEQVIHLYAAGRQFQGDAPAPPTGCGALPSGRMPPAESRILASRAIVNTKTTRPMIFCWQQ
jgi:hypothetical protein